MSASAEGTNTGATQEKFERTYTEYNPAPAQGQSTEILATVLAPATPPTP